MPKIKERSGEEGRGTGQKRKREKRGQTAHEVFLTKQSELIQDNESVKAHRRANGKASVFELDLGMLLLLSRFSRVRLCETP